MRQPQRELKPLLELGAPAHAPSPGGWTRQTCWRPRRRMLSPPPRRAGLRATAVGWSMPMKQSRVSQ
jgi:hypothetical protein